MLETIFRHRRSIDVAHVDIYSGPAFYWAEAACWALRRVGKPYIATLHGGGLPKFASRWPRRVRRLLAGATIVTAPSKYLCQQMQDYRQDITVLPNAIEVSDYPFRQRGPARPNLVWIRAFDSIYNPALAVQAIALVVSEFPQLRLKMVGPEKEGVSRSQLLQAASELGVAAHVELSEAVPKSDIPRILQESDVFLNTSDVDNNPVSVIEAMAAGLCVVSTNVGGLPYLVSHRVNALLVPPRDPSAMATGIRQILQNPRLAQGLSARAREAVYRRDWATVLPQWQRLFEQAARRKPSTKSVA
jgi:glycosyltransferase involved in cell wall biosynthesis